jgi:hypothetical protein
VGVVTIDWTMARTSGRLLHLLAKAVAATRSGAGGLVLADGVLVLPVHAQSDRWPPSADVARHSL